MTLEMTQRLAATLLLSVAAAACSAADGDVDPTIDGPAPHPQVMDGAATPEDLGFEVNRLERHAAVGQLVERYGQLYQGCSGTLVGDRVVVSAGHCVVNNYNEWANGGEPEVIADPSTLHYAIGDNVDEPLCMTTAREIHLHPDITHEGQVIAHDYLVVILEDSVWDTCEAVLPIQLNRDPVGDELIGELVLQGGFGSLDDSHDFSPQRFWSLVQITAIDDLHVVTGGADLGLPTNGDSGSGVWRRFEDGSLRTLGQYSTRLSWIMRYAGTHLQGALLDAVVDESLLCGPVDQTGTCRDDLLVRCDAQGFTSTDCRATDTQCVVADDGTPGCACSCDVEPFCQEDCPCDAACPCECNQSGACDEGCDCDPDCYGGPVQPDPGAADADGDAGGCSMAGRAPGDMPARGGRWLGLALLGCSLCRRRSQRWS